MQTQKIFTAPGDENNSRRVRMILHGFQVEIELVAKEKLPVSFLIFDTFSELICAVYTLSTLNLSKFDELGHSSNFDKWPPNLIESDPRPLKRIIMHFWPKQAFHETSGHQMNDPLPTQKNGQKIFFRPEMVKLGLVEISAPPKSTFLGLGGRNFFGPHQRGSKALVKSF